MEEFVECEKCKGTGFFTVVTCDFPRGHFHCLELKRNGRCSKDCDYFRRDIYEDISCLKCHGSGKTAWIDALFGD